MNNVAKSLVFVMKVSISDRHTVQSVTFLDVTLGFLS